MGKDLTILLLLFALLLNGQAQEMLEVHKGGTKKHYHFLSGDTIRLQLHGSNEPLEGSCGYFDEDKILLPETLLTLFGIRWIDVLAKSGDGYT